jgi:hypothetical protein
VAFFGPIGALIGMPIAAAVLAVVQTYGRRYELIPELHGGTAADPVELPHSTEHVDDVLVEARAREEQLDALAASQKAADEAAAKAERAAEKAARHGQ